jgi:hypothetical protein
MLQYVFTSLTDEFSPFNVFRYQTTRTGAAILTALVFCSGRASYRCSR